MTSRRAAVGIPVGVAAAVVVAVVATFLLRSGGGGRPAPLPLSLAGGGGRAEAAMDAKMTAGAPAGQGPTYTFAGPVPDGLPDEGDVYQLADGPADRDDVRRLAAALGLTGDITSEPDSLVVRDGDLVLRVSTTVSRMWNYSREVKPVPCDVPAPGPAPDDAVSRPQECAGDGGAVGICLEGADSPCNDTPETVVEDSSGSSSDSGLSDEEQKKAEEAKAREAAAGTSSGSASSSSPVMACPPPPPCPENAKCVAPAIACVPYEEPKQLPLPDESVARALAQKVFDATGVGDSVRMRAERSFDAWYISASFEVDDLEVVGFGHSVSIDTDGKIRDASGSLAVAEVLDRYPLVGALAGLERLEKQQAGFRTMELCAPAPGGGCGTGTPEQLEVTDVRLGLLFSPVWENEKEKVFLAPAWVYDVKGRDYPEAVIAITDEFLQAVTPEPVDPGQPEPLVDPAQTEPGVDPAPPATVVEPAKPEPAYS